MWYADNPLSANVQVIDDIMQPIFSGGSSKEEAAFRISQAQQKRLGALGRERQVQSMS